MLTLIALIALCQPMPAESPQSAPTAGDAAEKLRYWQEMVSANPRDAHANRMLGRAFNLQGNTDEAAKYFATACQLSPTEPDACYWLGLADYDLSRFTESLIALQSALKSGASNTAWTLWGIARTLEALGRNSEAEGSYKEAAGMGNVRAQTDYGMFLFHQGRARESIEILKQAGAKKELDRVTRSLAGAPTPRALSVHPSEIRFDSSTLSMVVRNGAIGEKHQVETMIAGVAILDYDNDGWPDVFIANGARLPDLVKADSSFHNRLFHNNQDGTFTDVTEKAGLAGMGYSMGVAAADYDNDGWLDLFVTGVNSAKLYHNKGNGTFEDVTEKSEIHENGLWTVAAGWFDYDNDGLLDLFVVRYVKWSPEKDPFCGGKEPGYRSYCSPNFYAPLPNTLYHNEGDGHFRDVSKQSGIAKHLGEGMEIGRASCRE